MTLLETVVVAATIIGAFWIYSKSDHELPDVLYSVGMLVVAGGWLLNKATAGEWPLTVMLFGSALSFAVLLAKLDLAAQHA